MKIILKKFHFLQHTFFFSKLNTHTTYTGTVKLSNTESPWSQIIYKLIVSVTGHPGD